MNFCQFGHLNWDSLYETIRGEDIEEVMYFWVYLSGLPHRDPDA